MVIPGGGNNLDAMSIGSDNRYQQPLGADRAHGAIIV